MSTYIHRHAHILQTGTHIHLSDPVTCATGKGLGWAGLHWGTWLHRATLIKDQNHILETLSSQVSVSPWEVESWPV